MHRRDFLSASVLLVSHRRFGVTVTDTQALEAIERRLNGRLGVAVIDTSSGRHLTWRGDERFPMCSTFKWLLAAHVLARVDNGQEQLDRRVPYLESDLLAVSPITRARLGEGSMPVADLAEAAVRYSDNAAANILLGTLGGPAGFTAWIRSTGDAVTRLDRNEPELNSAVPGDPRDTTTPNAMVATLSNVLLGSVLTTASRERLTGWLVNNTTGAGKLRDGFTPGWQVGDKTGMGANGATNDVAIIWPEGRAPVLVAAYLTGTEAPLVDRNGALADVARVVTGWLASPPGPNR